MHRADVSHSELRYLLNAISRRLRPRTTKCACTSSSTRDNMGLPQNCCSMHVMSPLRNQSPDCRNPKSKPMTLAHPVNCRNGACNHRIEQELQQQKHIYVCIHTYTYMYILDSLEMVEAIVRAARKKVILEQGPQCPWHTSEWSQVGTAGSASGHALGPLQLLRRSKATHSWPAPGFQ